MLTVAEILGVIVRGMVNHPDQIEILEVPVDDRLTKIYIRADDSDVGIIVGKGARRFAALREIVIALSGGVGRGGPRIILERAEGIGDDVWHPSERQTRREPVGADPDLIVAEFLRDIHKSVMELTPSDAKALLRFARDDAEDVRAYVLAQYGDGLELDVKRALSA